MIEQLRAALEFVPIWLMGLGIFAILWVAAFLGRFWRGLQPAGGTGDAGLVVSASLGLLALLLGFTVSMAVGRFDARRGAMVAEANAADDFRMRIDLLPAQPRRETLTSLAEYLSARLAYSEVGQRRENVDAARQRAADIVQPMWNQLIEEYPQADPSTRILLVESANHMFGTATARDAALGARLPSTLILLLIIFPISSIVLIGYVSGMSKGVYLTASTEMILLLTFTLLLVIDLDRPRSGTIHVSDGPLRTVQEEVRRTLAEGQVPPADVASTGG